MSPMDESLKHTYFFDSKQNENNESDMQLWEQQGEADHEPEGENVLQYLNEEERSSALETKESDIDIEDRRGLSIQLVGSQTNDIIHFSGTGTQTNLVNKIIFEENVHESSTLDHHNIATCLAVTNDTGFQVIEHQPYRNIRYMFDFIPISDDTVNPPH